MSDNQNYEVIFCVINAGFSEAAMEAAREAGAKGGTLIKARATSNKEAEEKFHIAVQPDREIILMAVKAEFKDEIMTALYKEVGINTPAQGVTFSVTANHAVGFPDQE